MYEYSIDLKCHSPIIHFQSDKDGAILRATEVKPKLDKFLHKKIDIPLSWHINSDTDSLDYKMRIEIFGSKRPIWANKLYYGRAKALSNNCRLTIVCFHDDLLEAIKENITEFFVITNFGAMQGKGFGSYLPKNITEEEKAKIPEWLKSVTNSKACYKISGYTSGEKTFNTKEGPKTFLMPAFDFMFDDIKKLYSIMKSGYNGADYHSSYLFQFFHKVGIGNEKAWMKKENIVPNITKTTTNINSDANHSVSTYRYVRALLGFVGNVSYIKALDENNIPVKNENGKIAKDNISIFDPLSKSKNKHEKKNAIERIYSPIFFKIIDDSIYITARGINEKIYGRYFAFINKTQKTENGYVAPKHLKIPAKKEFTIIDEGIKYEGIDGFLAWFMKQYIKESKEPGAENKDYIIKKEIVIL